MTSFKYLLSPCASTQDSNYWERKSDYSGLSQVSTLSFDWQPNQNNLELEKGSSLRKRGSVVTRRTGSRRILGGPKQQFHEIIHHTFSKSEYYYFFSYIKWKYAYCKKFAIFSKVWGKRLMQKQASFIPLSITL